MPRAFELIDDIQLPVPPGSDMQAPSAQLKAHLADLVRRLGWAGDGDVMVDPVALDGARAANPNLHGADFAALLSLSGRGRPEVALTEPDEGEPTAIFPMWPGRMVLFDPSRFAITLTQTDEPDLLLISGRKPHGATQ